MLHILAYIFISGDSTLYEALEYDNFCLYCTGSRQLYVLAVLGWSIGMHWLMDVSYARRVGTLWKETCDFTVLLQTNINWQWSIDRLACIDWLMFLMHAGLAVSRSDRWLALYGKKLVTLLYFYRYKLAMIDWSIGMHWLTDVSYARRVDSDPQWPLVGSYGKKLVTLLF